MTSSAALCARYDVAREWHDAWHHQSNYLSHQSRLQSSCYGGGGYLQNRMVDFAWSERNLAVRPRPGQRVFLQKQIWKMPTGCHGNQEKLSKIPHIDPMVLIFARYGHPIYINLHAKMKKIYPAVYEIAPIATVRQPDSDWGSGGCDVMDDVLAWRPPACDVTRRLCDVLQVGVEVPSMPLFYFFLNPTIIRGDKATFVKWCQDCIKKQSHNHDNPVCGSFIEQTCYSNIILRWGSESRRTPHDQGPSTFNYCLFQDERTPRQKDRLAYVDLRKHIFSWLHCW